MFASEGPLIGFPPSIGAFLRKKCRQHNELGHASCHVVLLARNCCVTTVLSYFVVDALLGHVCRDRARDCTTDSSPQSIAHCPVRDHALRESRPSKSRISSMVEISHFPRMGIFPPKELGWRANAVLACWLYEARVFFISVFF